MSKRVVKLKEWPFKVGEWVRLIWIGEPFKENNKWMFEAYFKNNKYRRKIKLDWANIHFLSIDKCYKDGDLNNGRYLEELDIINIDLKGANIRYSERDWEIWGTGFKDKTKSKTFSFFYKGRLYIMPIIEVIRSILAPNRFMLNRIIEIDTLDNYFTYEIKGKKLNIYFTSEYESKLLKNERINHLAWILTNINILSMFSSIGSNMWINKELKFEFLFNRFNVKARVDKREKSTMILEILSFNKKTINAEQINIYHPSLNETKTSNEPKKRRYVIANRNNDIELSSKADGSTKTSEEVNTLLINHEYESIPKINKVKTGRIVKRVKEDKTTKIYISENGQANTTADEGGEEILRGLEFKNISDIEQKGELEKFIEILKLLKQRPNIRDIQIIIGNLLEGKKGKRFSRLSDGITKRKYAIGKITMIDGRECSLIEVERENRSLSMLLLKANKKVNWKLIYSKLLLGLVDESGKWSNEEIRKIEKVEVQIYRYKHIKKKTYDKQVHIYKNIIW